MKLNQKTIVPNPQRNQKLKTESEMEAKEEAFLSGAGGNKENTAEPKLNKTPVMIRIDPAMIVRIDQAAKRLGISRSAFIVSSAAERLERME